MPDKWYEIWRSYETSGTDYLGSVKAGSRDEAERAGRELFGCEPDDDIEVEIDNEMEDE